MGLLCVLVHCVAFSAGDYKTAGCREEHRDTLSGFMQLLCKRAHV